MDTSKNEKQSFLSGAAWLAAATIIVKVIGALYKIPLRHIVGDAGFSYFNTAYDIYSVLLMISTAGLPVAMSRMVADAESRGNYRQLRRTFQTAFRIFFLLGAAGTILMCGFPRVLARKIGQSEAWYAIAALGPSSLLLCLTSAFRGFFQGQGNMRPTSVGQVLEAACKLLIGLGLAGTIVSAYRDIPMAAGGAILGVTIGAVTAAVYTGLAYRKAVKKLPDAGGHVDSFGTTAKKLLAIAVPITIGAAGLQIIALIDTTLTLHRLQGPCGYTEYAASELKGIYNFAQTIFNLPCALVGPVTISIIPAITAQLARGQDDSVRATEESAIRVMGLITMPCAFGLFALAEPIMALLGGYSGENLTTASHLMAVLGICVIFNSTVLLTNAIMQAHGHPSLPVINMFVGGLVKIVVNYILVGNPNINIQGAPVGTLCCYVCITILNVFSLRRNVKSAPSMTRNLVKPFLAAAIMGVVCFLCHLGLQRFTDSSIVLCAAPIALGAVCYCILVLKLKVLTYADCLLLPKGEKIAKILRVKP